MNSTTNVEVEAVVRYTQSQNIDFPEATQFKAIAGNGVQAMR